MAAVKKYLPSHLAQGLRDDPLPDPANLRVVIPLVSRAYGHAAYGHAALTHTTSHRTNEDVCCGATHSNCPNSCLFSLNTDTAGCVPKEPCYCSHWGLGDIFCGWAICVEQLRAGYGAWHGKLSNLPPSQAQKPEVHRCTEDLPRLGQG